MRVVYIGLILSTVLSSAAFAADDDKTASADTKLIDCQPHDEAREAADQALAEKAFGLMAKKDMAALERLLPELEAALSNAPDHPPLPQKCGDTIIIYGKTSDNPLEAALKASTAYKGKKSVIRQPLPYGRLGYIIGWIYIEKGDLERALKALERGYKNDPDYVDLAVEYANALNRVRPDQALSLIDTFLVDHPFISDKSKAYLLRSRGYALVELGRLKEALNAYEDSLKLDPKSEIARREIAYINDLLRIQPKDH